MDKLNIYQRMSAITSELQTVAKNLTVSTGKTSSYKAVSERDILDAVKPLEVKHGVYSYPIHREVIESNMLETEGQYGTKTTFMSRIKTVYRFVNVDEPTEYIETVTFAEGIDAQDKGSGKAMTYGDKYALMKAYKISTGDDPDQTASQETKYTRKPKEPPTMPTKVTAGGVDYIHNLCLETGTDEQKVLDYYKVSSFYDMSIETYNKACREIEKKLKG